MNLLQKRKLAYGKLELTNHDSAGGKNFAVLTSMQVNRRGMKSGHFLARDGISFLLKGIYNSKYHIRLYKAKNMKHIKATLALSLFLLAAKKKAIIVSIRQDS